MYAVMAVVGAFAGVYVAARRARKDGLAVRPTVEIAVAAVLAGAFGAKLWSIIFEAWRAMPEPSLQPALTSAGWSIVGGIIGGALGGMLIAKKRRVDPLRWADAASPGAALGVALGRVGCLLAGCCFGSPTLFPIALAYDDFDAAARPLGVPLHAVPIYESMGCVALAVWLYRRPTSAPGRRFALLVVGYGLIRTLLELLRSDYRGSVLGVPATTLGALVFVVVGLLMLRSRRVRSQMNENG